MASSYREEVMNVEVLCTHAGNDYNQLACIVSVYGCIVGREEVTAQWCMEALCTSRNDQSAVNCYNWLLGTTAMLVTIYLHTQIANIVIVVFKKLATECVM